MIKSVNELQYDYLQVVGESGRLRQQCRALEESIKSVPPKTETHRTLTETLQSCRTDLTDACQEVIRLAYVINTLEKDIV